MKKKILGIICAICVCLPCFLGFAGCSKELENFDGYTANISNYSSLAVGTFDTKKNNKKTVLAGTQDNNVNAIKFTKKGKSKTPGLNVLSFNQSERYVFITYAKQKTSYIYDNQFWNTDTARTYLIDKQTDKVYLLNIEGHFKIGVSGFGIVGADCQDYVVVEASNGYYKVGVNQQGELIINEFLIKSSATENTKIFLCDIYGNALVCKVANGVGTNYVLKASGELEPLAFIPDRFGGLAAGEPETFRAQDGKIYHNGLVLNQNGQFEVADSMPLNFMLPTEIIVESTAQADYYYMPQIFDGYRYFFWIYGQNIVKVTKDAGSYSVTSIPLDVRVDLSTEEYLFSGGYIYAIADSNIITRTNVKTGNKEIIELEEGITVTSLAMYNHNQIEFHGTRGASNVKGIIKTTGEVEYNYTLPTFICYLISPLR